MNDAAASYVEAASFRLEPGDCPATVVLLHGLGGDLSQPWAYTSGQIAGQVATRLAPDARAHGLTQLPALAPLTFDLMANDVKALVDHLDLSPRLVLVGVSMGACTALCLARRAAPRVHALVLIRPAWTDKPLPDNLAAFGEIASMLRSRGPDDGRAMFAGSPTCRAIAEESPSAAASLLDQFDKPRALERVGRLEELPRSVPYRDPAELHDLTAPTLLIGTQHDPIHPFHIAEEWAHLIPSGRLVEIASRDRAPEQHRVELRGAVDRFLADL